MASLEPDRMDDFGMYVWAILITVATLVISYAVAVWWQRRRDEQKKRA